MQWFSELFMSHTALQAVIIISVIIAFGLALGKIRVWGISLGVTFVFFAGILAGHIGLSIDPTILHYTENLGLVLFVYELGLKVGPGFFSSFRKGGLELNMRPRSPRHRHPHGRPLHPLPRHTHRRSHRTPLRSHHQHPRTRRRPAGPRTGRPLSQRSRPQLRRHLPTRSSRSNPRHHSPSRLPPPLRCPAHPSAGRT